MSGVPLVLRRITDRLRSGGATVPTTHHADGTHLELAAPVTNGDAVERFTGAWQALAGHVHEATPSTLGEIVEQICRACGVSQLLSWNDPWLAPFPLVPELRARDLALDFGNLPLERSARHERLAALASIGVGLTGTFGAVAESGSVVVVSGPGRSRLASLLPPVHIAIVRRSRVYPTLPDFLQQQPGIVEQGSNLVLISGPSRTADIEMTLTRGVHGPGEVHAVLLDDGDQ
jgi:L-lactate dehydrogenase complex protein LldG